MDEVGAGDFAHRYPRPNGHSPFCIRPSKFEILWPVSAMLIRRIIPINSLSLHNLHNIPILIYARLPPTLSLADHGRTRSAARHAAPFASPAEARDCSGPAPAATPAPPVPPLAPARRRREADERRGAGPLPGAPAPGGGHPHDVCRRRRASRRRADARKDDRAGGAGGAVVDGHG